MAVPRRDVFILGNVCSVLPVRCSVACKTYTWAVLECYTAGGVSLPAKVAGVGADGQEVTTLGVAVGKADIPASLLAQGRCFIPGGSTARSVCFASL